MRSFDELLREAVAFHGHLCPGQVLGVRMVLGDCRALGVVDPKSMHKSLVVFVEIDRMPTGEAVRVSARDDAREKVSLSAFNPGGSTAAGSGLPAGSAARG